MTFIRSAAAVAMLTLPATTVQAATFGVTDADIFLEVLEDGLREFSTVADLDHVGSLGPGATLDLVFGFDPDMAGSFEGFFEIGDGDGALLLGLAAGIDLDGDTAALRFTFDPASTVTGFEAGIAVTLTFLEEISGLTSGEDQTALIDVAPVPLPGSAGLLLLATGGLMVLGRRRSPSLAIHVP